MPLMRTDYNARRRSVNDDFTEFFGAVKGVQLCVERLGEGAVGLDLMKDVIDADFDVVVLEHDKGIDWES